MKVCFEAWGIWMNCELIWFSFIKVETVVMDMHAFWGKTSGCWFKNFTRSEGCETFFWIYRKCSIDVNASSIPGFFSPQNLYDTVSVNRPVYRWWTCGCHLTFFLSGCVRRDSEISYNKDMFLGLFSSLIQAIQSFISFYYIARKSTQPIPDSVIIRVLRNLLNHVNDVHANSICFSLCRIFFSDKWPIATA